MTRHRIALKIEDQQRLKDRLLLACEEASHGVFLDSNNHHNKYSRFEWLAAFGLHQELKSSDNSLSKLHNFQQSHQDWLLGYLSFELKNELENLSTAHPDYLGFDHLSFFVPQYVVYACSTGLWLESIVPITHEGFIEKLPVHRENRRGSTSQILKGTITKEQYLETLAQLKEELQFGNIYEINHCIEFMNYAEQFYPLDVFRRLNAKTSSPFAAYYHQGEHFALCASPERYLQRTGNKVLSQPMKGTAKRSDDSATDSLLKQSLTASEKERSENVMITDLVRNDLSITAKKGSVKVDELFGVYSYQTVHQMLSTVSSEVEATVSAADLIRTSFPMGSMTGAPKISALQLIDQHESFARGLYSGSIGYIMPNGDFDFNVVIRSLLYHRQTGYLSARVGGAITIQSDAEMEYQECMLKAESLLNSVLDSTLSPS